MKKLIELSNKLNFKTQYELREQEDLYAQDGLVYNELKIKSIDYKKDKVMKYLLLTSLPFSLDNTEMFDIDLWSCRDCTKCKNDVVYRRTMPTGNINAEYMVIGDAPGMGDGPKDTIDRALVYGPSSKILRLALYELGIYHKCWFTNLLKCSKLNNIASQLENVIACRDNLVNEITIIEPKTIILLGNHVESMFKSLYLKVVDCNDIKIEKIYHPSYYVRMGKTISDYASHINNVLRFMEVF